MREYRVFGAPGCGKTTNLAATAHDLVDQVGSDMVSICSLTRTAAKEIGSRDLPIPDSQVTTLHARCKRELHAGDPAETHVKDFAKKHPAWAGPEYIPKKYFHYKQTDEDLAEAILAGAGVSAMDQANILRQRLVPRHLWPSDVRQWYAKWEAWKREEGLLDYTGFLEAVTERNVLPYQDWVMVDEAQDHTPLQFEIYRKHWPCKNLLLTGDDDQCLFEWSGADPTRLIDSCLPVEEERVLGQSYRLPRAIHAEATRFIGNVKERKEKVFLPRDADGEVLRSRFSLGDIEGLSRLPASLIQAADEGRQVMVLTSCGYMTKPIVNALIAAGIPFHNPFRPSDRLWNPLRPFTKPINSFLAFSNGSSEYLSGADLSGLLGILGGCGPGKADLSRRVSAHSRRNTRYTLDLLEGALSDEAIGALRVGDLRWLADNAGPKTRKDWAFQWALSLADEEGSVPIPTVVLGTVHSVKGGEAQDVFLFPDRSRAALREASERVGLNASYRLFYVGMTRASERLFLMSSSDGSGMWG